MEQTETITLSGSKHTTKTTITSINMFIHKRKVSKKIKTLVYNTIYKPIITYGCESWALNNSTKS